MPGKIGLTSYCTERYPSFYKLVNDKKEEKVCALPYFELVKNRSGSPDLTFPMWNKLEYFDFDEMDTDIFKKAHAVFVESNCAIIPVIKTQLSL